MKTFTVAEARAHFSELVHEAMAGEEIVITKDNHPLLRLVPIKPPPGERRPGAGRSDLFHMAPNFDEPVAEFADYFLIAPAKSKRLSIISADKTLSDYNVKIIW